MSFKTDLKAFYLYPNLMLLINRFYLLKSKCSIFELYLLGHIQNLDRKSFVPTESLHTEGMNRKKFAVFRVNPALFWPKISYQ